MGQVECSRERAGILAHVVEAVLALPQRRVVLVAIDGVDGSGKSIFADQLAARITRAGRPTVRASADDFHHPRSQRYRRGRTSPLGFWLDSYDYDRLRRDLLDPLSSDEPRRYCLAAHDVATDLPVDAPWQEDCLPGAVLVFDGLFLHRPELRDYWDLSIFLDAPFAVTAARMAARDGTDPDPRHPSMNRYIGGQRLYLTQCRPVTMADIVIDHANWDHPQIQTSR